MTRVLSGAALLVFAVGVVWFAPPLLFLIVAELLVVLALVEYVTIARESGVPVPAIPAGAAAVVVCLAFSPVLPASLSLDVVLMVSLVVLGTVVLFSWSGDGDAVARASASLFPALYLGLPLGAMVAVRATRGPSGLFLLMLTVVTSDTAQYYTGRAFGRRPLAPIVSPKKTIEGAVGGFVFGAIVMAILGRWWLPDVPVALRALFGAAIVAVGISGDLFESMLKRSAGVKDSSHLIPGHGGILDRIDALLFAAPVYYVVLKYL